MGKEHSKEASSRATSPTLSEASSTKKEVQDCDFCAQLDVWRFEANESRWKKDCVKVPMTTREKSIDNGCGFPLCPSSGFSFCTLPDNDVYLVSGPDTPLHVGEAAKKAEMLSVKMRRSSSLSEIVKKKQPKMLESQLPLKLPGNWDRIVVNVSQLDDDTDTRLKAVCVVNWNEFYQKLQEGCEERIVIDHIEVAKPSVSHGSSMRAPAKTQTLEADTNNARRLGRSQSVINPDKKSHNLSLLIQKHQEDDSWYLENLLAKVPVESLGCTRGEITGC